VKKDQNTHRNLLPDEEGVQVSTTLGKLEKAFLASAAAGTTRLFMGAVIYQTPVEIEQWMTNQANTFGSKAFATPEEMVALLLRKRNAFAHESEVRCFIADPENVPAKSLFTISFDPNDLFEGVAFDPRLVGADYDDRERAAKDLGFSGKILNPGSYMHKIYEVPVDKRFREPEARHKVW
jgi:hypothetical protein